MNKEYLLNESKTFCMFPWVHLNVTPKGDIYPCCSNDYTVPFGNTKQTSLKEAFNNAHMKQLWRKASQKYRDKKTGVKTKRIYSGKGEQGDYSHLEGNYIY